MAAVLVYSELKPFVVNKHLVLDGTKRPENCRKVGVVELRESNFENVVKLSDGNEPISIWVNASNHVPNLVYPNVLTQ